MADPTTVEITFARSIGLRVTNGRASLTTHGDPEENSWMPTELFLSGLGSCMLATLAYFAQVRGIDVDGAVVRISGETTKAPTRFGRIRVAYDLPHRLTAEESKALIRAASRCKVHNTLAHPPVIEVSG